MRLDVTRQRRLVQFALTCLRRTAERLCALAVRVNRIRTELEKASSLALAPPFKASASSLAPSWMKDITLRR